MDGNGSASTWAYVATMAASATAKREQATVLQGETCMSTYLCVSGPAVLHERGNLHALDARAHTVQTRYLLD
jgi:hypothetical protein